MRPPDGSRVAGHRVGGQEVDVAVAAGGEHHGVRRMRLDLAGQQVADHDAGGYSVRHYDVEHLGAIVQFNGAGLDLAGQRLIRPEQELLAGLAPGIEGP